MNSDNLIFEFLSDFWQVYDYDWGLRDDFMGEASLALGQLVPQKRNDLVLTLAETGEVEKTKRQTDKKTERQTDKSYLVSQSIGRG